jgi:DAHP synthetase I family
MIESQPSTEELHARYGIDPVARLHVIEKRTELVEAIRNHRETFISVDGPCPLTINPYETAQEAEIKAENARGLRGYIALDRECFYKPRTNPNDWHGVDESDREDAYRIVSSLAVRNANIAAEISNLDQLKRFGPFLTMLWIGSRTVNGDPNKVKLVEDIAASSPDTVIAVKNGMDGRIDDAMHVIDRINRVRGPEGAPAVLIYRGGTNATTPETSKDQYKRAHEATGGVLFYDTAHGVEMAYHPEGRFEKSKAGQILASQALLHLTQEGFAPLGKLSEASDIESIMDPHMPLELAMSDSRKIYAAKMALEGAYSIA